jgi:8-oxo-dGTP pyrophosphatase MutT (NUDIX family)
VTADPRVADLDARLAELVATDAVELGDVAATRAFLAASDRPFDADRTEHVTASAFCVGPLGVLLHRHRLLGLWLQPGGHVDPGEPPAAAALRELAEETGVVARHLDPPWLVHVSVHDGPRGHRHLDCRWLVLATTSALVPQAGESQEVAWLSPAAALGRCAPDLVVGLRKALDTARALDLPVVASWRW